MLGSSNAAQGRPGGVEFGEGRPGRDLPDFAASDVGRCRLMAVVSTGRRNPFLEFPAFWN